MSDTEWDPTIYEADIRPADELYQPSGRIAVIRNSDRVLFRTCRRRWGWNSHLKGNLGPIENAAPLWVGSGFHFVLEDFHGYRVFHDVVEAFDAYTDATLRHNKKSVPVDWKDHKKLAEGMLKYYVDEWLISRDPLQTFIYDGIPQCEVNFRIDIPFNPDLLRAYGYDGVVYSGTIDRVIIDERGLLWIVEYKTAKQIQTMHFANDGQVSSYVWAGNHLYPGYTVAGVIYQQHRKDLHPPVRILADGKLSTAKNLLTTHRAYRRQLIEIYGDVKFAPVANVDYLNHLEMMESSDFDKLVRRDKIFRNEHQCQAEGVKILMELEEMLNPDIALYPSPSRSCAFMCSFNNACVSLDDGSDWEYELEQTMKPREVNYDSWRQELQTPQPQQQKPLLLQAQAEMLPVQGNQVLQP